jgi:hypothetical protein
MKVQPGGTLLTDIDFPMGTIYPDSLAEGDGSTCFLARLSEDGARRLGVIGDAAGFEQVDLIEDFALCPLTAHNAATLRARFPWLNPVPLGMQTSFGFGDRIGCATPGHVQALRQADPSGAVAPIFAQQSVRENTRTGRTPQEVLDDATWGVFQAGWRGPWGADADHVKEVSDLAPFVAVGYTFYTVDPSDHVDNAAQTDSLDALRRKTEALPWGTLQSSYPEMVSRYCAGSIRLDSLTLEFDEAILSRALAKYGRALAHTVTIARELAARMGGRAYDLEMSVDETDTPTSAHEHYFIAGELARCGVPVVSLAPRFVGKFQKGVDYMGDLAAFEVDLARHAAIMRHFGTYKLSIHTGSDKFSIYPLIAQHAGGCVHVKTAGTSYLEALRVLATANPGLFKAALELAHARFERDRKTYFLDCQPERVPHADQLADGDLPGLLEDFHARQLLHVTYGSILDELDGALTALLDRHEAAYQAALVAHFQRHIQPFVGEP